MSVDGPDCMWMFRTARQESVVVDMRPVVSGIVRRTLATRGRKRGAPRRQAWGDEAKRKVRGTTPLATTTSTMKMRKPQARAVGGWSEAEGPRDNTACDHHVDHEKEGCTSSAPCVGVGGWSGAEGPRDNTACDHHVDHEK